MPHRLLNVLTALSLLLCVALAALWVRSYRVGDEWEAQRGWRNNDRSAESRAVAVASAGGRVGVMYVARFFPRQHVVGIRGVADPRFYSTHLTHEAVPTPAAGFSELSEGWEWAGFGYCHVVPDAQFRLTLFVVPYWALLLPAAFLPALRLIRFRRRPRSGHCASCDYDLRATTGRCPECGTSSGGTIPAP